MDRISSRHMRETSFRIESHSRSNSRYFKYRDSLWTISTTNKMVNADAVDDNEYERQRLANIEKNKKLLKYNPLCSLSCGIEKSGYPPSTSDQNLKRGQHQQNP